MKKCDYCGSLFYGEENFCRICGSKLEESPEPGRSLCAVSLVFGILGWTPFLPVIGSVVSLITGRSALKQGESKVAAAGVVLSVVELSFAALIAALIAMSAIF